MNTVDNEDYSKKEENSLISGTKFEEKWKIIMK